MKKMIASIIIILVCVVTAAVVVNRYFYSWTGLLLSQINFCSYKSVSTGGYNGYPVPMSFRFDTQFIAQEMSRNNSYVVSNRYNGDGALVSRNFDGVVYIMYFESHGVNAEGMKLDTGLFRDNLPPGVGGEKCTTPSYSLEKKVFAMINDLPLSESQRDELKQHVWVVPTSTMKLF
jgi:hypothetical protein